MPWTDSRYPEDGEVPSPNRPLTEEEMAPGNLKRYDILKEMRGLACVDGKPMLKFHEAQRLYLLGGVVDDTSGQTERRPEGYVDRAPTDKWDGFVQHAMAVQRVVQHTLVCRDMGNYEFGVWHYTGLWRSYPGSRRCVLETNYGLALPLIETLITERLVSQGWTKGGRPGFETSIQPSLDEPEITRLVVSYYFE